MNYAGDISDQWSLQRITNDPKGIERRGTVTFSVPDRGPIGGPFTSPHVRSATIRVPLTSGSIDEAIRLEDLELKIALHHAHILPHGPASRFYWDDVASGRLYGVLDLSPSSVDIWDPFGTRGATFRTDGSPPFYFDVPLTALAVADMNTLGDPWTAGFAILPQDGSRGVVGVYAPPRGNFDSAPPFELLLTYGPPPPLGDFTGDGRTDQGDLDFALLNWGRLTDQEELDAVLLTWGESAATGAVAVPEPSAVATFFVLMVCIAQARRLKSRQP